MKILRALIIVALTPFALFLGVAGCVDMVARSIVAEATASPPQCSQAAIEADARADLDGLPVKPCVMHSQTGDFVCDRQHGCLRKGVRQ